MLQFYVDYLERLADLHGQIEEALADLPAEALDWSPGPEMNTITVLVTHLAGAEGYWIGDVAGQVPSGRERAAEFRSSGQSAQALIARMDASRAHAHAILSQLSLDDLAQVRSTVRHPDRSFTVAFCLLHALEHTGQHLGHIQMVRQLYLAQS